VIGLNIIILYARTARWTESTADFNAVVR
jgi:hypothetical protein